MRRRWSTRGSPLIVRSRARCRSRSSRIGGRAESCVNPGSTPTRHDAGSDCAGAAATHRWPPLAYGSTACSCGPHVGTCCAIFGPALVLYTPRSRRDPPRSRQDHTPGVTSSFQGAAVRGLGGCAGSTSGNAVRSLRMYTRPPPTDGAGHHPPTFDPCSCRLVALVRTLCLAMTFPARFRPFLSGGAVLQ